MATKIIQGFGNIALYTSTAGLFAGGFSSFSLEGSPTTVQGRRYNTAGKLIVSDEVVTEEVYTLTLGNEVFDMRSFELGFGEEAQVSSSIAGVPFYKEGTVPSSGSYEITDADITTSNDETVVAVFTQNGTWSANKSLQLSTVLAGPPATGEVFADGTNGKLVFHSSAAGAPIAYWYTKTLSSKVTIGVESSATTLRSGFSCIVDFFSDEFSNNLRLWMPSLSKTSLFSLQSGDVSTLENTFTLGTPAGSRSPWRLIQL